MTVQDQPAAAPDFQASPISPRLEELVVQISRGRGPNSGRFCGNCYTPIAADRERCAYCGRATFERPPVDRIPTGVFEIVRAKRHRESMIVNGLAFLGLGIGIVIAILVAMVSGLPSWWTAAVFIIVMLIAGRGLAAVLGGWLGDSLGYRSATALVRRRWAEFERSRARSS